MSRIAFAVAVAGALMAGGFLMQDASAQFQQGGVNHPGEWHVGEGLRDGDLFSYELCHIEYEDCAKFRMDIWMDGTIQVGSEEKLLAQVVVYDGNKIARGTMELGTVAPEPTGGSESITKYRSAFKSSIVWLSAFANADAPKRFDAKSWGKIGNIGGEQILPKEILSNRPTPAGSFDEVILIGWRTGGQNSQVYVVDDFPFPISASTWTHVSQGIPPQEYKFVLLNYEQNVTEDPFAGITPTVEDTVAEGCPSYDRLEGSIRKTTDNSLYQIHMLYAPEFPVDGCPMKWQIKFLNKVNDNDFLSQVQYDVLVFGEDGKRERSIAEDRGRSYLYSPAGISSLEFVVQEGPGTITYVILVRGLGPEGGYLSGGVDTLDVPLVVEALDGTGMDDMAGNGQTEIPGWIKTNAGFWVDGFTSDKEFVTALEFLIKEGIITVPPTTSGSASGGGVPSWIKQTAGFWVDGGISDAEFVSAIQFLIQKGIISVS